MKKIAITALLGAVSTLVLVPGVAAATPDLSPLISGAIQDIVVPVALATLPVIGVFIRTELKRAKFIDQQTAEVMARRADDVLNKAITYAADQASKYVSAHEIHLDTGNDFLKNAAIDYALSHAPKLMKQVGKTAGQQVGALLAQKVQTRLVDHPTVAALKNAAAQAVTSAPTDVRPLAQAA